MSHSSVLSREIGNQARSRGEAYFREGRARVVSANEAGANVIVRGTRTNIVALDVEEDTLLCECDCPKFQGSVSPCEHVWAAILAAEKEGFLGEAGRLRHLEPIDTRVDPDDFLEQEQALLDEQGAGVAGRGGGDPRLPWPESPGRDGPAPPPAPRRAAPPGPAWEDALDLLRAERHLAAPAHVRFLPGRMEIVYLVDLGACAERGRFTMELLRRERRRDGSWGKPRPLHLGYDLASTLPDPADRRILALLQGARSWWSYGYPGSPGGVAASVEIPAAAVEIILREACATGRCLVRRRPVADPVPLNMEDGEAWRFRVEVRGGAEPANYEVTGMLTRGAEVVPLPQPDLLLALGLVFAGGRVGRLDHGGAFPLLVLLRRRGRIEVPRAEGVRFVSELLAAGRDLLAAVPEELRLEEARVPPRPAVRIQRPKAPRHENRLSVEMTFDYAGWSVHAGEDQEVLIDPDARRAIVRDREAECAAVGFLYGLGFRPGGPAPPGSGDGLELAPRRLPSVVPELLRAGWRVEAEGKLYRSASGFRIQVSSGIDWFELRGGATYGGMEVPLPALLAALKKGESLVLLGDGSYGVLPEEWLARYAPAAGLGEAKQDHVRFSGAQAGFLDALLASEPEAACDETFERVRRRLRGFEGVQPADPPAGFLGTLRSYQKDGLGWLYFLREFGFGGCLADDMGLGKTIQVLALLEARRAEGALTRRPALVVAPRSLVFNWAREAARFTPRLRLLDHTGQTRARAPADLTASDVVLTTYGTLRRDIALLREVVFDTVVLDEAQAIKNAGTQAAKAVRLLRGDQRLALSGTPIENHLGELWSLFEFLNPGMLGASSAFQFGSRAAKDPDGPARALLARALRPFVLRRTKAQVASDLPERTEQTLRCELVGTQRRLYDELRDHYRASLLSRVAVHGLAKSTIHVLEALLRLRQAACHPALIDRGRRSEESAKFEVLFAQLDEVLEEGHKAIVFSQFTSLLALVRERLDRRGIRYAYLDGSTGARARESAVDRFQQEPGCPLFLASLKAGGFGLNLTAAEYVYLLDPWWNPAVEMQAIDRAHRIGQTRPVFAYRIVAAGTIEEKILEMQASKRELADSILAADASLMRDLTREDLEMLLA